MDNLTVKINQDYVESEIKKLLDIFSDTIIRQNYETRDLMRRLEETEKRRIKLARAYAKKMRVLK